VSIFSQLLGTKKTAAKPYPDAGLRLSYKLIDSLSLSGWKDGLPAYTPEEIEAIEGSLAAFQRIANETVGGNATFHPEAVGPIQRIQSAQALEELAGKGWRFSDKSKLPDDWKLRVSTYLKAWACNLTPDAFLQIAEILTLAGYKTEAREACNVVLLFPTYAETFFGGAKDTERLVTGFVEQAREQLQTL